MADIASPLPDQLNVLRRRWRALLALVVLAALVIVAVLELAGITALLIPRNDNLKVVAVYAAESGDSSFIRGAQMAVDRINARDGGVLGRQLDLDLVMEAGSTDGTALEAVVAKTLDLSDYIARTRNLLAVVGHEWSDTAIAASSIYNLNNILYLASHATAQSLTNHGFDTVFALQPDNSTNAQMIAKYALDQGLHRFIVLSDKSDYGKESVNFFTAAVAGAGADLVFRGFLSNGGPRSTDDLLMFILDNKTFRTADFDAIFIASSSLAGTADFIKRARVLGLAMPILGMEYIFSSAMESAVGMKGMKDVVGVSLYDAEGQSEGARVFAADFRQIFGQLPDLDAALGYDAITLLGDVSRRAGTIDPTVLADTLKVARYKDSPFVGVTGPLLFDRNGLVTDTGVYVVRHDGTGFHTVAQYQIPSTLAQVSVIDDDMDGEAGPLPAEATPAGTSLVPVSPSPASPTPASPGGALPAETMPSNNPSGTGPLRPERIDP
ncbi:hypothetical protein GCM10011335_22790 [Aureimonas glaciei]|uniref:Leucine-binding protein domain-containing protein n=1 Tax=Aureimonas glaciei TaxID=1776957 RepID=A0A917DAZ0_9HYPH|nr:hypothetical protein GCM10011335_22790 [Aureimonas glaciei]